MSYGSVTPIKRAMETNPAVGLSPALHQHQRFPEGVTQFAIQ